MIERLEKIKDKIIQRTITVEDINIINDVISMLERQEKFFSSATPELNESALEALQAASTINIGEIYIYVTRHTGHEEETSCSKN